MFLYKAFQICVNVIKKGSNGHNYHDVRTAAQRYRKHTQGQTQKHMQNPCLPTPSVVSHRSGLSHAKEHNVFKSAQSKLIPNTRHKDSSMMSYAK